MRLISVIAGYIVQDGSELPGQSIREEIASAAGALEAS
jgi:hypothetical protein